MLDDMSYIDVLGSRLPGEVRFRDRLVNAKRVRLADIEPYYHGDPWSSALEGQVVLVVHPFDETIRAQYSRRDRIFSDRRVLPKFELKTLKAVQSIAGAKTGFRDWFEALRQMEEDVAGIEFDVALSAVAPTASHSPRTSSG